mmetsp:Transcript_8175/g.23462  ORF Transcript_8175/g.23462 Transcript_8175/m.23462 type:complete len:243 (+) Transcript_8175:272-1000(+)
MASSEPTSYAIKRTRFFGRDVPIILQNENGPCPLLAIANVLLLRNVLQLPSGAQDISQSRLLSLIAEHLLDSTAGSEENPSQAANMQQNVSDAISHLPKLTTGLDVNVRFDKGAHGFEFTDEVVVFDLLGISLVHGWLIDGKHEELAQALAGRSYNELVCWLVGQDTALAEPPAATTAAAPASAVTAAAAAGAEGNVHKGDLQEVQEVSQASRCGAEAPPSVPALALSTIHCSPRKPTRRRC